MVVSSGYPSRSKADRDTERPQCVSGDPAPTMRQPAFTKPTIIHLSGTIDKGGLVSYHSLSNPRLCNVNSTTSTTCYVQLNTSLGGKQEREGHGLKRHFSSASCSMTPQSTAGDQWSVIHESCSPATAPRGRAWNQDLSFGCARNHHFLADCHPEVRRFWAGNMRFWQIHFI